MAKKKVSNAPHEKQEVSVKPQPMESEKLESLKSLNQMLLKEAVERRQQVDSLAQSKDCLEMELTRSNSEREALGSELARLAERAAELEVERTVVAVFAAVQVGEKGEEFDRKMRGLEREVEVRDGEIVRLNGALSESRGDLKVEREASRRVRIERDVSEARLKREIDEGVGLRANLTELGDKMREVEREIEESRAAYSVVVRERRDMEMRIKLLMGEKDASEKGLVESNKLIEKMKEEISVIVREKEGVVKEKNDEIGKRRELETVVSKLNVMVENLQKEEGKLQKIVTELDRNRVEGEEKLSEMGMEMDRLVGEMKLSEKRIEGLVDEKSAIEKDLNEAMKNLAEKKLELEGLANENIVILEEKNRLEGKVEALGTHVDELKAVVSELEESNGAFSDMIKSLESQVGDYKYKLEKVYAARDGAERSLAEEKQNALKWKSKIEKDLNEAMKNLAEKKLEFEGLANEKIVILEEKNRLEGKVGVLGTHVDELKAALSELEESNGAFSDMIKSLESQVGDYKCKLEKVYAERDGAERSLAGEKQNALKLKSKIQELENRIEESDKASEVVKAEKAAILSEKVGLESWCGKLREEIASLQEAMVKSRAEFDSMKSKAEMADANSELVLNMLKGTSNFCSKEECGGEAENVAVDGEVVRAHAVEMETIKKAFKSKAAKVEDMERQLEALQSCVVDEKKKKSLLTMLSSASTILAAVALSIAYVARGH